MYNQTSQKLFAIYSRASSVASAVTCLPVLFSEPLLSQPGLPHLCLWWRQQQRARTSCTLGFYLIVPTRHHQEAELHYYMLLFDRTRVVNHPSAHKDCLSPLKLLKQKWNQNRATKLSKVKWGLFSIRSFSIWALLVKWNNIRSSYWFTLTET